MALSSVDNFKVKTKRLRHPNKFSCRGYRKESSQIKVSSRLSATIIFQGTRFGSIIFICSFLEQLNKLIFKCEEECSQLDCDELIDEDS